MFEVLQHQRDRRKCPYRSARKQRIRIPISGKTMSSTESYFGLRAIDSLFHWKHNMQCLKYSSINEIVENVLTVRLGNSEYEFRFPEKRCQPPDRISDYEQSICYFIGNAITTKVCDILITIHSTCIPCQYDYAILSATTMYCRVDLDLGSQVPVDADHLEYGCMARVPYIVQLCYTTMYCTVDLDSDLGYQVPGRTGYRTHPLFNEEIAGQLFLLRVIIKETQFSHPPA